MASSSLLCRIAQFSVIGGVVGVLGIVCARAYDCFQKKQSEHRYLLQQICSKLSNNLLDLDTLSCCSFSDIDWDCINWNELHAGWNTILHHMKRETNDCLERHIIRCLNQNISQRNVYKALVLLDIYPHLMHVVPPTVVTGCSSQIQHDVRMGWSLFVALAQSYVRECRPPNLWNINFECFYADTSESSSCYWEWAALFCLLPSFGKSDKSGQFDKIPRYWRDQIDVWKRVRDRKRADKCEAILKPFLCRDVIVHVLVPYMS